MGPKVAGVSTLEISRLPLGSLGTKWHLGVGFVARHKIYYKGEGGGLLQFQAVVSFVSFVSFVNLCLFVVHSCTKVPQLRTNQLVVWFVWIIESLVNLPSPHLEALARVNMLLYPRSVANQGMCLNFFSSVVFTFGFIVESMKKLGGASGLVKKN